MFVAAGGRRGRLTSYMKSQNVQFYLHLLWSIVCLFPCRHNVIDEHEGGSMDHFLSSWCWAERSHLSIHPFIHGHHQFNRAKCCVELWYHSIVSGKQYKGCVCECVCGVGSGVWLLKQSAKEEKHVLHKFFLYVKYYYITRTHNWWFKYVCLFSACSQNMIVFAFGEPHLIVSHNFSGALSDNVIVNSDCKKRTVWIVKRSNPQKYTLSKLFFCSKNNVSVSRVIVESFSYN